MATREPNCGCMSGTVAAVLALAGYVGYLAFWPTASLGWRARVLTGVMLTLAAAMVGKLRGIINEALRRRKRTQRAGAASR